MKFSEETKKAIKLLRQWSEGKHVYNLFFTHDIEYFQKPALFEYIEEWFGFDIAEQVSDQFYVFAYDGTGGAFCLWDYEGRVGDLPVIFLGSEGQTTNIAANILDFAATFCYPEFEAWEYDDLLSLTDEVETIEDLKRLLNQDVEDYTALYKKEFKLKRHKQIEAANALVPDFEERIKTILSLSPEMEIKQDPLALNFSYQNLTVVPDSILDNLDVKTLDLSDNDISSIPDTLGQLVHLTELSISNNNLTELPKFVESFGQLDTLDLANNQLTKLDIDFTKLPNLKYLHIQNNPIKLEDIHPSLFKSKSLALDFLIKVVQKVKPLYLKYLIIQFLYL